MPTTASEKDHQNEPHESNFCFYLRFNLRHFDEYTNSIHEGTNCRLKYNTAPVDLSTKIEKAIAIICNNAERSRKRKSRVASINFRGTKVYLKLQCGNNLVAMGESILSQKWINRLSDKSLKTSPSKWLVIITAIVIKRVKLSVHYHGLK